LSDDCVFVERMDLGGAGARVGVKDSIDIAGFATRLASPCLADAPPAQRPADVVRALLEAGCRIVGKTNMHELAYGVTGINHWSGTPVNPRAPGRVPGGSSSGSAVAVATELVDFALGNDTGGSIRIPAACCGVYGLKPSYGRVSRVGAHPQYSTLDCVGPLARDLATIECAMTIIDASFRPRPAPLRATIGWLELEADAAPTVAAHAALARAPVSLRAIRLPSFAAAFTAALTVIARETWAAFGHLIGCERLGTDVRARLLASREVSAAEVDAAELVRRRFRSEVDAVLGEVDALALPTLPVPPPTLAEAADASDALRLSALVRPFNLSGHPALSLPLPDSPLPAGLQLVGRSREDEALCALGRLLMGEPGDRRDAAPGN
jgi:amidase